MRAGFLAALGLILAPPLAAQDLLGWRAVDAETGQINDVAGLEALAIDFPNSGSVRLRLLTAYLETGDDAKTLEVLRWLKQRGYVFSEGARAQIPRLIGADSAETARDLLLGSAPPIEASEVVAIAPAEAGLVESVYSPDIGDIYVVTSITRNALFVIGPEQEPVEIPLDNSNDLAVLISDHVRNIGWVSSSNLDGSTEESQGFTGLIGLRGGSSEALYISAPEGVSIADIALGGDGTVYASDPLGGGVYRAAPGAEVLEALVEPGTFRSPQGLAVSEAGDRLYVSDYRYGLAVIDFESGGVSRLGSDIPAPLDGVDGLWLHAGELIAVQNGTSPMRISAFTLSDDGNRIIAARILEQAHTEWTEPLGGTIVENALVYVGTGQWDRFDKGEPVAGMPAIPTQVRRLPLGPDPD